MNSPEPQVSVLMSVYNGERYLKEAIDSVLAQTNVNFEFLIIDDASTDRSREILEGYTDPRIFVTRNRSNLGLTKSLNLGLDQVKGKFVARMDADDICSPDRLEKEVNYLESHPSIDIVGSWVRIIEEHGIEIGSFTPPISDKIIRWQLHFENPIAHPSVMIRTKVIFDLHKYNEGSRCGQDYELWLRAMDDHHFSNIPEYLLTLRKHRENISEKQFPAQVQNQIQHAGRRITLILKKEISPDSIVNLLQPDLAENSFDNTAPIQLLVDLWQDFNKKNTLNNREKEDALWYIERRVSVSPKEGSG